MIRLYIYTIYSAIDFHGFVAFNSKIRKESNLHAFQFYYIICCPLGYNARCVYVWLIGEYIIYNTYILYANVEYNERFVPRQRIVCIRLRAYIYPHH